jgi:hypothetical protein
MAREIFLFFVFFSFFGLYGQSEKELLHEKFLQRMEKEKTESTYQDFRKVKNGDENYIAALVYRNNFGWALDKVENLKEDIPAILGLINFSAPGSYYKIFNPQKFPASEWSRFYDMSVVLLEYFKNDSASFREVFSIKVYLELIMRKDDELLRDLPSALSLFKNEKKFYTCLVREYANVLNRNGRQDEAELIYKNEYEKSGDFQFLNGLVKIYSFRKKYSNILSYSSEIQKDSVGVLLFQLAEAHLNVMDTLNARKYFDLYTSKIIVDTNRNPMEVAIVDLNNNIYHNISPRDLEQIGDFYFMVRGSDYCKYYNWAKLLLNQSTEPFLMNKLLIAIDDEKQKKAMLDKMNQDKEESQKMLLRIEVKLQRCTLN